MTYVYATFIITNRIFKVLNFNFLMIVKEAIFGLVGPFHKVLFKIMQSI